MLESVVGMWCKRVSKPHWSPNLPPARLAGCCCTVDTHGTTTFQYLPIYIILHIQLLTAWPVDAPRLVLNMWKNSNVPMERLSGTVYSSIPLDAMCVCVAKLKRALLCEYYFDRRNFTLGSK